ncbi:kinase-like domain-containing protein [Emericellopsis atlantica]|uniref:Kinase-like domain-containing protein n=1 Tax=Emericellopsis atlantica TaxID=2614577 RepID=A0A9P7ZIP8_9HYPO|nr:kinase-like domain-containing protein [Emericellopsis atlantica]KAG9252441.1 kinase-like domain-containing protein [Emericellopsis atlantica]
MTSQNGNSSASSDDTIDRLIHAERDQFIASLPNTDILRLAASCHPRQQEGTFFQKPVRGSYNICYFVRFPPTSRSVDSEGEKWVIRVPIQPCLGFDVKVKLESEVATMQLLADRTTIPAPKLIAYGIGDHSKPIPTFLILEYVQGEKLMQGTLQLDPDKKQNLYTSLADIYIQLRRLEFDSIGCLVRRGDNAVVGRRPVSIDTNRQELEGRQPMAVQSRYLNNDTLQSASAYTHMLLDLADNAFKGLKNITEEVYSQHAFREHALAWVKPELDHGPFVLVHGDFECRNFLVNDACQVISVLDWEWSRVVPLQFFQPPLWLRIADRSMLAGRYMYEKYLEEFDMFLKIVESREQRMYGRTLLADEWAVAKQNSGIFVAWALENWTFMDTFAQLFINVRLRLLDKEEYQRQIQAFVANDPSRAALVAQSKPASVSVSVWMRVRRAFQAASQGLRFTSPSYSSWGGFILMLCGTAYVLHASRVRSRH